MSDGAPLEADRVQGAPHPRETPHLIGQEEAEAAFLDAYNSHRLHHGWLITGPRGVGKATLAWRIARFLLATPPTEDDGLFGAPPPPTTLEIDPGHPVAHRLAALSEPGLFLVRRPWDEKGERLKQEITVEEIRRLKHFFEMSSADGGGRVVIIDAADEMNVNAANAVLKLLEEPPKNTTLLLIAHQPSRLLPTILSRCRRLRCGILSPVDLAEALEQAGVDPGQDAAALAALSEGSVGTALRLITMEGLALYSDLVQVLGNPNARPLALKLADSAVGRPNADRFALLIELFDLFLARAARAGISAPPEPEAAPGEARLLAQISPNPQASRRWAELAQTLGARARHGRAVNLDPAALILDMVLKTQETAAQTAA
ncbi:DNA polymerase III subunit delta' [Pseudoruegeria sp. HB172150]|uniref:DNA polymerase III subunit delta' n=1 Tax=Pseudoruegeria sp. HB172150 TaxID=2721164 RepID=UPI001551A030|nr:DNA polymerase III subunit delta' [Pseudoruegeria sp. HB172150]